MRLIAHRGASHDAPENSMAAFRLAMEQGADGLELDVWLTKDRRVAVIHDRKLKRTMRCDGCVDERTSKQLAKLGVPMLCDVLEMLPHGRRVFVEIKGDAGMIPHLKEELAHCPSRVKDIKLLGFDIEVMTAARKAIRDHEAWLNIEPDEIGAVPQRITELKRLKFAGVSLGYSKKITPHVVGQFNDAGLGTTVWVVDDVFTARRMQQWGFDYLMTNKPAALRPVVS
jgi:glycerophosphoryl diester phosphodiesterase